MFVLSHFRSLPLLISSYLSKDQDIFPPNRRKSRESIVLFFFGRDKYLKHFLAMACSYGGKKKPDMHGKGQEAGQRRLA